MPNGKSAGCDGLSVIEIYKVLWQEIGQILFKAILFAYDKGELHLSARQGIISLIM